MKLKYIGHHQDGVDVVMPNGISDVHVPHGGTLDTSNEHAAALLEQPANWESAEPPKKPRNRKPKSTSKSKPATPADQTAAPSATDQGGDQ